MSAGNDTLANGGPSTKAGPRRGPGRETYFISRAIMLEESGVSVLSRLSIVILSLVIAAFVAWAAVTQLEEVAVGSGRITPVGKVKRVQSEEGGTVVGILVKEGDLVAAGQPLMKLDPTQASSNYEKSLVQQVALLARKERLMALVKGSAPDFSGLGDKHPEVVAQQGLIHASTVDAVRVSRTILDNQNKQYRIELKQLDERERLLREQFRLVESQLQAYDSLFSKKLVGISEYSNIKRLYFQVQEILLQVPAIRSQLQEKITDNLNRQAKFDADLIEKWMMELAQVEEGLAQVQEVLKKYEKEVRQLIIRSPEAGVVHDLKISTIGAVIRPGEAVMEIVPQGERLNLEIQIAIRDAGHVRVGQPVNIKFTAYDHARYGGVTGRLEDISPTALSDGRGAPYYKGIVSLEKQHVGDDPTQHRVIPGMTAVTEIKTGRKTLLEYLLKPIYLAMSQSFHER